MAEDLEHPPGAGRGEQTCLIVADHPLAIADAKPAHARGEFLRAWQHVGQGALGIRNLVDIEELGAGNMAFEEFGAGIAAARGKMP